MPNKIVFYDTMVYRYLANPTIYPVFNRSISVESLLEAEQRKGLVPYVNPVVIIELIDQLMTLNNNMQAEISNALTYLYHHTKQGDYSFETGKYEVGLVQTPTIQLFLSVIPSAKFPPDYLSFTSSLYELLVTLYESNYTISAETLIDCENITSLVRNTKKFYIDQILKEISEEYPYSESGKKWGSGKKLKEIITDRNEYLMRSREILKGVKKLDFANSIITKCFKDCGISITPTDSQKENFLKDFSIYINLINNIYISILVHGIQIDAIGSKKANWVFDLENAILAGSPPINNRETILITQDNAILEAAKKSNRPNCVLDFESYLEYIEL